MRYQLATSTHWKYDTTEKIPFLKSVGDSIDAGFTNLDCCFLDMRDENCKFRSDGYKDWIFECKEFVEQKGAKWVQAHAVAPETLGYTEVCKQHIKRSIECCSYLGVEWIVMHHIFDPKSMWGSSLSGLEFNLRYFAEFLEVAEKYNVGIAIENQTCHPFYRESEYARSIEELLQLVDKLGGDHVGVCWDVGHCNVSAAFEGAEHLSKQSELIKLCGDRIKATHIHDNNAKKYSKLYKINANTSLKDPWCALDEHIMPYQGDVDWDDVIKGLDSIHYNRYFTYETHTGVNPYPDNVSKEAMQFLYHLGLEMLSKSAL